MKLDVPKCWNGAVYVRNRRTCTLVLNVSPMLS